MAGTSKDNHDYLARLSAAFQGEVRGQAMFETLAQMAGEVEAAEKWRTLAALEVATREKLAPLLRRHGLDTRADEEQRRLGQARGEERARLGWRGAVEALAQSLPKYIRLYAELEAIGPPEDRVSLAFLRAHEVALADFAEAELAGRAASLAPVQALLGDSTVRATFPSASGARPG